MKKLMFLLICLFIVSSFALGQCTCMGGASVGGITPLGGSSDIGIIPKGKLRSFFYFAYSFGNTYYNGDSKIDSGLVKSYRSTYASAILSYGLLSKLTIDAEIGYFIEKFQQFEKYSLSGSGFSALTITSKYNLIKSSRSRTEWTVGAGLKIPLELESQNLPQNLQSSTGAYGGSAISFLHKGFNESGWHFILLDRFEINAANKDFYQYGPAFINSFFIAKNLTRRTNGLLEFRSDIRMNDVYDGEKVTDSGSNLFIIAPQLTYTSGGLNISVFADIPIYKYYYGHQLSNTSTVGIAFSYQPLKGAGSL